MGIKAHFKIGIWSSAGDEYVTNIVSQIKPDDLDFEIIWGRSRCTPRRDLDRDIYYWEKRLDKLKKRGYTLEKVLIVDDSPEKAKSNFGNAIYTKAFMGDSTDDELRLLYAYLFTLKNAENIRKIEKRNWRRMLA